MARDRLFLMVIWTLVGLIVAYALVASVVLIVSEPSDTTITRFISGFGTIFAGVLGLCSGYLIGTRANGNGDGQKGKT